jgi:hypothetical protein
MCLLFHVTNVKTPGSVKERHKITITIVKRLEDTQHLAGASTKDLDC